MAELILTEAEKQAPRWLQLDADAIGKVVLSGTSKLTNLAQESAILRGWSAVILMIWHAFSTNADELKLEVDGLTFEGNPVGDFEILVRKKQGIRFAIGDLVEIAGRAGFAKIEGIESETVHVWFTDGLREESFPFSAIEKHWRAED